MKKLFILQLLSWIPIVGWCSAGDVFTALSGDVMITYKVLNESDKTCQVGIGIEDELAIPEEYTGEVVIPEQANGYTVTTIGRSALDNPNITAVTLPSTIIRILADGLCGTNVYISDLSAWCNIDFACYDTSEDHYTWGYARNLYLNGELITNLVIPSDITEIKKATFRSCQSITTVDCSNVVSIGKEAFYNCRNLVSAECNTVEYIYDDAFFDCSQLRDFTTSANLIYIGRSAFQVCKELSNFNIPDKNSLKTIADFAFRTSGINRISLPSVESIGEGAFGYTPLSSVLIGRNVISIEPNAFLYCENLTDVYCLAETVPSTSVYAFGNSSYRTAILHVPDASISNYQSADPWKYFGSIISISNTVTMSSNGLATYCNPFAADFTSTSSLKAYIASGFSPSTGELLLTRVYNVPAGEGVLLKGEAGNYEIPYCETDMVYSNLLKGVTTATNISPSDGDYTNFILANGSHGIGFYTLSQEGEIAAGKAYLRLPTSALGSAASRQGIKIRFDDEDSEPTGIDLTSNSDAGEGEYYDMQGRKVTGTSLKSGLYILRTANGSGNGKKLFIK